MATVTRSRATEEGATGAVVQVARDDARELAGSVKERANELTSQISTQGRSLLEEARSQVAGQARNGTERLAGSFRQFGEQVQALAEGRPDEAPALSEYLWRAADTAYGAADRLHAFADDVEDRGFSGVLEDVQTFARRRPGAFLLGAAALGFGIGRLVKAQREDADEEEFEEYDEDDVGRTRVRARAGR